MNKNSNKYVFIFALIVCVVCSFVLALVSEGLRPRREANEAIDVKKNILKAVDLRSGFSARMPDEQILTIYHHKIQEIVVDREGHVIDGAVPEKLDHDEWLPVYIYREEGEILAYCFPVEGKGLWSTIYGYVALEADAVTVRGLTFYRHAETPGLGGEVSSDEFTQQFRGKKIYDEFEGRLRPVEVVKGRAADLRPGRDQVFAVDGITGATLTSQGVERFLAQRIRAYEPYLQSKRR